VGSSRGYIWVAGLRRPGRQWRTLPGASNITGSRGGRLGTRRISFQDLLRQFNGALLSLERGQFSTNKNCMIES